MERYMLHLKNTRYGPENSREVVYKARDLASEMNASIRVARIAKKFVELDVSVEKDDLDKLLEKLSPIGPVDNIRHVFEEEIDKEKEELNKNKASQEASLKKLKTELSGTKQKLQETEVSDS